MQVLPVSCSGRRWNKSDVLNEKLNAKLRALTQKPIQHVEKNPGAIFESDLNIETHIGNKTKRGFYHLKRTAGLSFRSRANTVTLMHAFIG